MSDDASRPTDLELVCNKALEWSEEYGFTNPSKTEEVYLAIYRLAPQVLEPSIHEWVKELSNLRNSAHP